MWKDFLYSNRNIRIKQSEKFKKFKEIINLYDIDAHIEGDSIDYNIKELKLIG